MNYPQFIKKNDIIGVTAPSAGIVKPVKIKRLDNAKCNLEKLGYRYLETENVRKNVSGRSSTGKQRAKEFMELWNNADVSAIILAEGGDFLVELLEYLEFENLKSTRLKWIQGYSDVTVLVFLFTTLLDIATIYCDNVKSYGMESVYKNLVDSLKIMEGQELIQESYESYEKPVNYYEESSVEIEENPYENYDMTEKTEWKNLNNESKVHFSGRSIGGCFDVIQNLIGTKYDRIKEYISKYKEDGIVWFLEVFEMSTPQVFLNLWQMKNAGYFENCSGIIFGRSLMLREDYEISFRQAVKDAIGDLNIPIIYDADIGHVAPQMPIVSGAILDVYCEGGKGKIKNFFK